MKWYLLLELTGHLRIYFKIVINNVPLNMSASFSFLFSICEMLINNIPSAYFIFFITVYIFFYSIFTIKN